MARATSRRDGRLSPFVIGIALLALAAIVTYLSFAKDVPLVNEPYEIKAAFRDTARARPCGSPASRSARCAPWSTRAPARGRRP
jgi:hypothetical protein